MILREKGPEFGRQMELQRQLIRDLYLKLHGKIIDEQDVVDQNEFTLKWIEDHSEDFKDILGEMKESGELDQEDAFEKIKKRLYK